MASEQVGVLETELKAVLEEITRMQEANEGETFSEADLEKWNRLNAAADDYKKRVELARRDRRMAELKGLAEDESAQERANEPGFQIRGPGAYTGDPFDLNTIQRSWDDPSKEGLQFRDRAMRVVEDKLTFRNSNVEPDNAKQHVTRLLEEIDSRDGRLSRHIIVNGSPAYKRAFGKYLKGDFLNSEETHAFEMSRALSLTAAAGGVAVPTELDPTVIPTSNYTINPFRAISRVIPVTTDTWKGVSSGAVTATFGAEATPTTDSSPTLAQITISTERASSFIPFSIEIGQDWGALQSEMGRLLGEAKDVLEATKFTLGSGTNEPIGLITTATAVYTASSSVSISVGDLYGTELALAPRFRRNASWLFTRAVAQKIRGFDGNTTATGGSLVWIDNLRLGVSNNEVGAVAGGYNARVLGYPAYESYDMSSTFATTELLATLGDFQQFIVIDRVGMAIEVIPHLFDVTYNQPTGQRGLYAYWRTGSNISTTSAFVTLQLA